MPSSILSCMWSQFSHFAITFTFFHYQVVSAHFIISHLTLFSVTLLWERERLSFKTSIQASNNFKKCVRGKSSEEDPNGKLMRGVLELMDKARPHSYWTRTTRAELARASSLRFPYEKPNLSHLSMGSMWFLYSNEHDYLKQI